MEILDIVVHAICEKKAQDVRVYDVTSLTPFMDSMIVCSTTSIRQNNAIAQNIKDRLRKAGYMGDMHIEGDSGSKWLLIDLKEVVVHLFVNEERQVYNLDRLYSDVPVKTYDL